MPRTTSYKPRKTTKGWEISIPPDQSPSGKRRRIYFASERAAKTEASKLRRQARDFGNQSVNICPDLAAQALRVEAMLAKHDVTLLEVARDWLKRKAEQDASISMGKAFEGVIRMKKPKLAAETLKDYLEVQRKLPGWFSMKLVCDLTSSDIEKALDEMTGGTRQFDKYRSYISPALNEAVVDGHLSKNPIIGVRKRNPENNEAVTTVTPAEMAKIFDCCQDYREEEGCRRVKRLDCRPCDVPLAFMAFAGLRPAEVERLQWDDVSLELRNIKLPAPSSKTKTLRNIHIEDVLAAWIETVPEGLRAGSIVPPDWKKKKSLVMKRAGLPNEADILRHSYGSFHLAAFKSMDSLKEYMGHAHMTTFFRHYFKAFTKREALPYWKIGPAGWEAKTIEEVA